MNELARVVGIALTLLAVPALLGVFAVLAWITFR